MLTQISGGLGSDILIVAPRNEMIQVIANDGLGYSGIVLHSVDPSLTLDATYKPLLLPGISARYFFFTLHIFIYT